jgi:hypothetical protein
MLVFQHRISTTQVPHKGLLLLLVCSESLGSLIT